MVKRLLIDALWRNRWIYLAVSAVLLPLWLLLGDSPSDPPPISVTALSLLAVEVLGMFAIATLGLRELRHLPVTNRDLWRTTWVVGTAVSTGILLATKAISVCLIAMFGGITTVSAEAMLLSAMYDFSWSGAVLVVLPLLGYIANAGAHRGTLAASLAAAGMFAAVLACFGLPILVGGSLPTHVGELTPVTTGVLIACMAIAFGALAWTPQRGVLAGERARAQAAFAPRAFRLASPKLQRMDRLTGISRVVVPHLLATLALPVGACLALATYGVIVGSGPWWFVPQTPTVFDPADTGDRGLTYFVLVPCAIVPMQGLWTSWARVLRVLPMSVRQINALLVFTPFATWTVLWLVGVSAYSLAYGTPATLRLDLPFGLAGIGALAHAALLRFGNTSGWALAFTIGLMSQLLKVALRDAIFAQVMFAATGTIALCTAAFINHRTLTRSTSSSRAYRRLQSHFGFEMPSIR